MPSQEYAPPEYTSLSPSESGNVNKRKAPEDNFAEEVFCPCSVGPCIVLTSAKPHSQGRKFYRCPKSKEDGQCGFFQWQDEPPRKQQVQANFHTGKQQNFTSEADGMVPQKPECRCGLEAIEITSNSAANPGRVFYKCPKNEAEGRCKFFKWQDELQNNPPKQPAPMSGSQATHQPASTKQAAPSGAAGGSGVFADGALDILQHAVDDDFDDNFGLDEALNGATAGKAHAAPHSYAPSSMHQGFDGQQNVAQQQGFAGHQANGAPPTSPGAQPPEILNCDCGLQCSYIMAKTAKNDGRWFYRCPKPKEEGQCRFFQWADELGQQPQSTGKGGGYAKPGAAYGDPAPAPGYHTYSSPTKMAAAPAASNDACFKCGQTGHWSRDCPSGGGGGGAAGGGSCFKCGQEGHWARDCPNPSSGARPGGGTGRAGGGGGRGPGYGGGGRGYGGAQGYGASHGGGTAAASGACYKCGQSGHWTNSCPN